MNGYIRRKSFEITDFNVYSLTYINSQHVNILFSDFGENFSSISAILQFSTGLLFSERLPSHHEKCTLRYKFPQVEFNVKNTFANWIRTRNERRVNCILFLFYSTLL